MFSTDCAEAKTLSQAHIHGLEIGCVMQLHASISSLYLLAWTIGVGYTSNLKSYYTLKNNSHWIRVVHYCCLLLAASMTTTIEQLPVKDRLSQQFSKSQGCFTRARWFWNTMLMMFYLNVFYLPTLKDYYKLWNEVMFWFTQMMCYDVYISLLIRPDMSRSAG